jgi:hypothetical protein
VTLYTRGSDGFVSSAAALIASGCCDLKGVEMIV